MRATWRRVRGVLPLALVSVMFSVGQGAQDTPGSRHPSMDAMFTLRPSDNGAQEWADLTASEHADVARTAAWADQDNVAVHGAFSAGVTRTTELRALQEAQGSSGLEGIETLGVVP